MYASNGNSLVIIGNANEGSEVIADGDIFVFGKVQGRIVAGLGTQQFLSMHQVNKNYYNTNQNQPQSRERDKAVLETSTSPTPLSGGTKNLSTPTSANGDGNINITNNGSDDDSSIVVTCTSKGNVFPSQYKVSYMQFPYKIFVSSFNPSLVSISNAFVIIDDIDSILLHKILNKNVYITLEKLSIERLNNSNSIDAYSKVQSKSTNNNTNGNINSHIVYGDEYTYVCREFDKYIRQLSIDSTSNSSGTLSRSQHHATCLQYNMFVANQSVDEEKVVYIPCEENMRLKVVIMS